MRTQCGALQGAAGSSRVHFLAPYGCLTSGVHAARPLHHLCSRMSVTPRWRPNQGERRVAEPPWCWPYLSPTAETPGCYPTLLLNFSPPSNLTSVPQKRGEKNYRSSQTCSRRRFSLCLRSVILYCMSCIWQMFLFWKTADIENAVSDCTANGRWICLTLNVISFW